MASDFTDKAEVLPGHRCSQAVLFPGAQLSVFTG